MVRGLPSRETWRALAASFQQVSYSPGLIRKDEISRLALRAGKLLCTHLEVSGPIEGWPESEDLQGMREGVESLETGQETDFLASAGYKPFSLSITETDGWRWVGQRVAEGLAATVWDKCVFDFLMKRYPDNFAGILAPTLFTRSFLDGVSPDTREKMEMTALENRAKAYAVAATLLADFVDKKVQPEAKPTQETLAGPPEPGDEIPTDALAPQTAERARNIFRWTGSMWQIRYNGEDLPLLSHCLGLFFIWKLLCETREEGVGIAAIALSAAGTRWEAKAKTKGRPIGDLSDAVFADEDTEPNLQLSSGGMALPVVGNLKDPEVQKLIEGELDRKREAKQAEDDPHKQAELSEEIEKIEKYLRTDIAIIGGEKRYKPRTTGGALELARKRVYSRIEHAYGQIRPHHEELERHLRNSISGGGTPSYKPDSFVDWQLD